MHIAQTHPTYSCNVDSQSVYTLRHYFFRSFLEHFGFPPRTTDTNFLVVERGCKLCLIEADRNPSEWLKILRAVRGPCFLVRQSSIREIVTPGTLFSSEPDFDCNYACHKHCQQQPLGASRVANIFRYRRTLQSTHWLMKTHLLDPPRHNQEQLFECGCK